MAGTHNGLSFVALTTLCATNKHLGGGVAVTSLVDCQTRCAQLADCGGFDSDGFMCYLKASCDTHDRLPLCVARPGQLCGYKRPPGPALTTLPVHIAGTPFEPVVQSLFEQLGRSPVFQQRRNLCVASPLAADFDAGHLIERTAYHHMLGVDCQIFIMDWERSRSQAAMHALRVLTRQPSLVVTLTTTLELQFGAILMRSLLWDLRVEFFAYLDADELLALGPQLALHTQQFGTRPTSNITTPPNIIRYLQHTMRGSDVMYLHTWTFGTSGHKCLDGKQTISHSVLWWLNQRDATTPWERERNGIERKCVCGRRKWGKMLGRVHSSWELRDMHHWTNGTACFPDGERITSFESMPDPCRVLPLSLNHYRGTLYTCLSKAANGIRDNFPNQRKEDACHRDFAHEVLHPQDRVSDDSITRYEAAIDQHAQQLFGHYTRVSYNCSGCLRDACEVGRLATSGVG